MSNSQEWKPVEGIEGYFVSSDGQVASTKRGSWKLLHQAESYGYLKTTLSEGGESRNQYVHVLVAAAFIGAKPAGLEVRHKDGDKKNNTAENLEYGTSSENTIDAVKHGTHNNARKTHCKRGHAFTPGNTEVVPLKGGESYARRCIECHRMQARGYQAKKRAARKAGELAK